MTSNFIWQESITKISAPYICFFLCFKDIQSTSSHTSIFLLCYKSELDANADKQTALLNAIP